MWDARGHNIIHSGYIYKCKRCNLEFITAGGKYFVLRSPYVNVYAWDLEFMRCKDIILLEILK